MPLEAIAALYVDGSGEIPGNWPRLRMVGGWMASGTAFYFSLPSVAAMPVVGHPLGFRLSDTRAPHRIRTASFGP